MASDHRRSERVAAAIREEVATFLNEEMRDPRFGFVTVTGVDVTRDLYHATIYVSVLGEDVDRDATLAALTTIAPRLRGQIGRALRLRAAPELVFKYDRSVANAARIETLLASIKRDEAEGSEAGGSDRPASPSTDDAAD